VPAVPDGLTIRSLRASEAGDYVTLHRAAFDTLNMTDDWRERTIKHRLYTPELDLVAEDAQGRLVAFCIGWIGEVKGERIGQIEPLGVMPEFRKRGIGRAVLLENLRRMYERGVRRVLVDAESYNPASQHLYESVGFREVSRVVKYFHRF
jgi:ribosomal protein S18 acetylase RimI-like enzyme